MKRNATMLLLASILATLFISETARALSIKRSIDELTAESTLVVLGKVMEMRSFLASDGLIYTEVTIRGDLSMQTGAPLTEPITVRVPGGVAGGMELVVSDTPTFVINRNVLLFLKEDEGYYEPVAMRQGKYTLQGGNILENNEDSKSFLQQVCTTMQTQKKADFDYTWPRVKKYLKNLQNQQSTQVQGTNQASATCFRATGNRWNLPRADFKIGSNIPISWIASVASSASAWNQAGSIFRFRAADAGGNNEISIGSVHGSATLGETQIWTDSVTHLIMRVTTTFNRDLAFSTTGEANKNDVQNTMTHEFGHWLSLDEITDESCSNVAMYQYSPPGDTSHRFLEQPDKDGIISIYGSDPQLAPPAITNIVLLSTPTPGQQFYIEIDGENFNTSNVRVVVTDDGFCATFGKCFVPHDVLIGVTRTQIARAPLTLGAGTYQVFVQNGEGGDSSGGYILIVDTVRTPPHIDSLVPLSTPVPGQSFDVEIDGRNFDTSSVRVVVTDNAACSVFGNCSVPNNVLNGVTGTKIARAPLTLGAGTYQVFVQNGTSDRSNGVTLTINALSTPPHIDNVTLLNTPMPGQQFSVRIDGRNFNASNVRVVVTGDGFCATFGNCAVPRDVLGGVTSSQIASAPLTLGAGSYQLFVQNGIGGDASNGWTITVTSPPPPLLITSSSSLPDCAVGSTYSQAVSALGGIEPYAWSIVGGNLPPGMSFSSSGVLSGTPTVAAGYNFDVMVMDSASQSAQRLFSLNVVTVGPQINSINVITAPGQQIAVRIEGSSFDPSNVRVLVFGGSGCPSSNPCFVSHESLGRATSTQISSAPLFVGADDYVIGVENGHSGQPSNFVPLNIGTGTEPTPLLVNMQKVYFGNPPPPDPPFPSWFVRIDGSGFTTFGAEIVVVGPGCQNFGDCVLGNIDLRIYSAFSTSQMNLVPLGLPTNHQPGIYQVFVRNGQRGRPSNGVTITLP